MSWRGSRAGWRRLPTRSSRPWPRRITGYPVPPGARPHRAGRLDAAAMIAVPFELALGSERLAFITTTTVFGTPLDLTLAELAVESFLPADERTVKAMRCLAES